MITRTYQFSEGKNLLLKATRNISFEEIIDALQSDQLLETVDHPRYDHQKLFIVEINNYAYLVPFVEKENDLFLKTIFPCRKTTKKYLRGNADEKNKTQA